MYGLVNIELYFICCLCLFSFPSVSIFRHPPAPLLSFLPDCIDFGSQVCAHQSVTHSLTIINTGSAVGSFSLTAHHLPSYLTITPLKGTVSPDSQQHINVSMMMCTYLLHSTSITAQYFIIPRVYNSLYNTLCNFF